MQSAHAPVFGEDFVTVICLTITVSIAQTAQKQGLRMTPERTILTDGPEQMKALKRKGHGRQPIYNHETGMIDPPEVSRIT